jgi:hypothetical protein
MDMDMQRANLQDGVTIDRPESAGTLHLWTFSLQKLWSLVMCVSGARLAKISRLFSLPMDLACACVSAVFVHAHTWARVHSGD